MRQFTSHIMRYRLCWAGVAIAVCTWSTAARGQDARPGEDAPVDKPSAAAGEFEVPATAAPEELLKFIDSLQSRRPPAGADREAQTRFFLDRLRAVVAAAEKTLAVEGLDPKHEASAAQSAMMAMSTLSSREPQLRGRLLELATRYRNHDSAPLATYAQSVYFQTRAAAINDQPAEQQSEFLEELLAVLEKEGLNRETYSLGSSAGRALGYSSNPELGARLYDRMSELAGDSADERIVARAGKMKGAARRLRLLNNEMTLTGLTADGEEFDWNAYRGKVVLVDFWASWCGPCLAELPNMKKTLEKHGERGFTIVGVNMDKTYERFEECVELRGITWVNLVSKKEGELGWDAPMATYYGVTSIPTAILVDQKGRVVSLRARGEELEKQVAKLLGE